MTLRILDAGCGRGDFAQKFLRARGHVVAVDVIPEYIESAKRRFGQGDGIEWRCQGLEELSVEWGSFDEVYCIEVLEHVTNYERSLDNVVRALKPGGRLVMSVPHPRSERIFRRLDPEYFSPKMHQRLLPPRKLKRDLRTRGLQVQKVHVRGFLAVIEVLYGFMRGFGIEYGLGGALRRDAFHRGLAYLNWLVGQPLTKRTREVRRRHGLPLAILHAPGHIIVKLFDLVMARILPKQTYVEAIKTAPVPSKPV